MGDIYEFPNAKPIAVEGGIATRNKRGTIGTQWWSRRFIEVLESFGLDSRLSRGRTYARQGQVISIDVSPGLVDAVVQGSRRAPYHVVIRTFQLSHHDWDEVQKEFAKRAAYMALLLAGEVPKDIETAFANCDLSLFPDKQTDINIGCSCPDNVNPCKHAAAVLYLLAERFDDDPFLLFEWRGRSRREILQAFSSDPDAFLDSDADIDEAVWERVGKSVSDPDSLAAFWNVGPDLEKVRPNLVPALQPELLINQLGVLPDSLGGEQAYNYLKAALIAIANPVSVE